MRILTLALLLFSFNASADIAIRGGGISYHIASNEHTNSLHRTFQVYTDSVMIGYARNSYNSDIFYAAYFDKWETEEFTARLHYGVVHGYGGCYDRNPDLCPIIVPEIEINTMFKPSLSLFGDALILNFEFFTFEP